MCQLRPSSQYNFLAPPHCGPAFLQTAEFSPKRHPTPNPQLARVSRKTYQNPPRSEHRTLAPCSQPLRSLRIAAAAVSLAQHPGFWFFRAGWLLLVQPKSQSFLWVTGAGKVYGSSWHLEFPIQASMCPRTWPGATGQERGWQGVGAPGSEDD